MADEYIKRGDAKEYLKRAIFGADQKIDRWIDSIPSADVRPVVRGRWDKARTPFLYCQEPYIGTCSVCQFAAGYNEVTRFFKYCPNCGADMREVADNG